jgi:hypothetical protein
VPAGIDIALVASSLTLGLRHGVDWDHIAAIGDLTGAQPTKRGSMVFATLYAGGHASVVLALGSVAIFVGDVLPDTLDEAMRRIVGVTLIALGGYIALGLLRHGTEFHPRGRLAATAALFRALARRPRCDTEVVIEHEHAHGPSHGHQHLAHEVRALPDHFNVAVVTVDHRHRHVHRATLSPDPFRSGRPAAFGIGMLHGIGAETPTQLLVYVAAASVGGVLAGEVLLIAFTIGLVASNTAIAIAGTVGFLGAGRNPRLFVGVSVVTAAFSLALGISYLLSIEMLLALLTRS